MPLLLKVLLVELGPSPRLEMIVFEVDYVGKPTECMLEGWWQILTCPSHCMVLLATISKMEQTINATNRSMATPGFQQ